MVRQKAQALQLPAPSQEAGALATQPVASGGVGAAEFAESGDDFAQLRATLIEMLRMPDGECKRAARRLYKTWHPDKCNQPQAAGFFRIAKRFARQHGQETLAGPQLEALPQLGTWSES